MESAYLTESLAFLDQPGNPSTFNNLIVSQQYNFYKLDSGEELCTSFNNAAQANYVACDNQTTSNFNNYVSISNHSSETQLPIHLNLYSQNGFENTCFDPSSYLSPQMFASSSAAHSPQAEPLNEIFDLSLDDIFKADNIDTSKLINDELLDEVLNDAGYGDIFGQIDESLSSIESTNNYEVCSTLSSSASSSPKRKYSTDSSHENFVDCFFESSYTNRDEDNTKNKRNRSKPYREERVARKKKQNRNAALRYRSKKKTELHSSEQTLEELEFHRNELNEQIKKLQTEFDVILPLAKAAFTFDAIRSVHLNQLIARVNTFV